MTYLRRTLFQLPVVIALSMLVVTGCQQADDTAQEAEEAAQEAKAATQETAAEVEDAMRDVYREVRTAMSDTSSIGIVDAIYTPDAILWGPDAGAAEGREEIEAAFQQMQGCGLVVHANPVDVEVYGDLASEYGKAHIVSAAGDTVATEAYFVLWKKHEGTWKMHRDFVSGTLAPSDK